MKKIFLSMIITCACSIAMAQEFNSATHCVLQSDRSDGKLLSTRAIVQNLLEQTPVALAFKESFTTEEFGEWQLKLRDKVKDLMKHPTIRGLPAAQKVSVAQREGYSIEKWEGYPLPNTVMTWFVLIPHSAMQQTPAVLCIPGSGQTKEALAGEDPVVPKFKQQVMPHKNNMAIHFVKEGLIAVVVDNPCTGEACDLEKIAPAYYDYETSARVLLEMGWSYLGYTSYLDLYVLNWMKNFKPIRKERIIVSGFSLGTEPLMVLGNLDPSIYAFVYNDFLCRTKERAIVLTCPDSKGYRRYPNSIRHLIPGFLNNFDFPDLVAALAPRPILFTEGGLDRDFNLIQQAYVLSGQQNHFTFYHYEKYGEPSKRSNLMSIPKGQTIESYLDLVNVDPDQHYFKAEIVIPWIKKLLAEEGMGIKVSP